jgi:putative DNA primase/helicase
VHWDVIRKRIHIVQAGASEVSLNEVYSLAALNRFPSGNLLPFINELGQKCPINPVGDWIRSTPWDGLDRMKELYATVLTIAEYPNYLKEALLYRWLLSATAAALSERGFFSRGVLTFQGPQGVGKTRWINRLMPAGPLRDSCIKLDLCIDGSKDSLMIAMRHWIAELGELESSFRRDMSRLKGVITNDCDKFRPPYGRVVEEFPRRTVFAATVNDEKFLIDQTGNSRWWTVPVESLDYEHSVDMQQVFAQLAVDFRKGKQWWLTGPEEDALADWNTRHRTESAIAEKVRDYLNRNAGGTAVKLTATQLAEVVGVPRATNAQAREVGAVCRDVLGRPKRIRGIDKWPVPMSRQSANLYEDLTDQDNF